MLISIKKGEICCTSGIFCHLYWDTLLRKRLNKGRTVTVPELKKTTVKICPPRGQSQRRLPITGGGSKIVLNWFEWNLPPHAIHWLVTRWSGAAAHWSDQNLLDKSGFDHLPALYGFGTEHLIYVFPEKELRDLSPISYIHVSVTDLNIPRISSHIWLHQNRQADPGNIKSLTDQTAHYNSVLEITRLHSFISGNTYMKRNIYTRFSPALHLQCVCLASLAAAPGESTKESTSDFVKMIRLKTTLSCSLSQRMGIPLCLLRSKGKSVGWVIF